MWKTWYFLLKSMRSKKLSLKSVGFIFFPLK